VMISTSSIFCFIYSSLMYTYFLEPCAGIRCMAGRKETQNSTRQYWETHSLSGY